ncbi:MAG: hypothetical protein AB1Z98_23675 [Nannocystaceae bacterium]
MEQTQEPDDRAKPYAAWSSLAFGLIALGLGLWVLLSGDVIENFVHPPKDDPLLIASLVNGILGTLAGIVGVARREPLRLVLLGLGISVVAVLAKFFLAAVLIAFLLLVVVALLGGIG